MVDHLQRVERLRALLGRLAPESNLENMQPQLEVMRIDDSEESIAQAGLDVLMSGQTTDLEQTGALEAIIHKRYRPVVNVVNDTFAAPPAPWTYLGSGDFRTRIESTLRSIGRIEVPNDPRGRPFAGTGFVVGENLLMTNRHVAMIFATGLGRRGVAFVPGQVVGVDFKQEIVPTPPEMLTVTEVVMIHPYWDMALLRVSGLSDRQTKLTLSVDPADGSRPLDIVVVGYPAQDDRNPIALQNEIFAGVFNVKRMQPGKLLARRDFESFGRIVNSVTHDSSTLGGNSGSAVVDVTTGQIIGLHFAGLYLDANFAVPTYELARDPQVVDAGVNFAAPVAVSDNYLPVWQQADAAENLPATVTVPAEPAEQSPSTLPPASQSISQSIDPRQLSASITIPITLTVTFPEP